MSFNENTRVKIPALLHLHRLGYQYLSLSKAKRDEETNIFTDIFTESIIKINNQELDEDDAKRLLENVSLALDNEDLGRAFYNMLVSTSSPRLIDFKNFNNNSFHVVTKLTCKNGDDEFRPDITLLINGMPLAFIEVKKTNNCDGILAERDRINDRFKKKAFRKFINISQILVTTRVCRSHGSGKACSNEQRFRGYLNLSEIQMPTLLMARIKGVILSPARTVWASPSSTAAAKSAAYQPGAYPCAKARAAR